MTCQTLPLELSKCASYLLEVVADIAPSVGTGVPVDPLKEQCEHGERHMGVNAVDGHTDNVAPATSGKLGEVVLRDPADVADEHAPVEPPTLQLFLDALERSHIHCVAGKDPVAERKVVSGDRQSDDDLGCIAAPVLRVTALARRGIPLGSGGQTPAHPAITTVAFVFLVDLKMERRGVVEDEFDVEVEQIGGAKVDRLLKHILVRFEEVHGPVQVLESEPLGSPMRTSLANHCSQQ